MNDAHTKNQMWFAFRSDGAGLAVSTFETVYCGTSEEEANKKAQEESRKHHRSAFYVMRATASYWTDSVVTTKRESL